MRRLALAFTLVVCALLAAAITLAASSPSTPLEAARQAKAKAQATVVADEAALSAAKATRAAATQVLADLTERK